MNYDIVTGQQSVTSTGAVTGSLDTSAMAGDYSLNICIQSLTDGATAVIAIEDTNNATPFADARTVATLTVVGKVDPAAEIFDSIKGYEIPSARLLGTHPRWTIANVTPKFGAANTAFRAKVTSLTGGATLVLRGWLGQ